MSSKSSSDPQKLLTTKVKGHPDRKWSTLRVPRKPTSMTSVLSIVLLLVLGVQGSPRPTEGSPTVSAPPTDPTTTDSWTHLESYLQVTCDSHYIQVKIPTPDSQFSGMVYPQGLSKNSSCLKEYFGVETIEYSLPLRSCNTMTVSASPDGDQEYFNTIVLEPHPKLVTGHGRGFPVRCKQHNQPQSNIPSVGMRILRDGHELSGEHVKIGDPLVLNITVQSKHSFPFVVTDCKVRDGLGWAEETLVNSEGCTMDSELMGQFVYTENTASVDFLAHKFPYSPSVYYACAVKICKHCHPPFCNARRDKTKREVNTPSVDEAATVEVYDGLYVNEVAETDAQEKADEAKREKKASGAILCFNQRDFALAIAISGLILMIAVILLIFILCFKRRGHVKGSESGGSSVYSGGYTNTAYSHSS